MAQQLLLEGAAPSTPAANYVSIYAKADGFVYGKDDAGLETRISNDIGSYTATTKLPTITATVAANALTIGMSPVYLDFHSATLGSGTVSTILAAPANTVISSGSTAGTIAGVQSDIYVICMNNAGTAELAWVNAAGGVDLGESGLITTTAEGGAGAADSASTVYSTTARTNLPYRVVGLVRSTQATPGTWVTAPSLIQGAGGRALNYQMLTIPAVATTSGTAVDFTGIPSWVKRITVMLNGVSTNGISPLRIQLGGGSVESSGYIGYSARQAVAGNNYNAAVSGFELSDGIIDVDTRTGSYMFNHFGSNLWIVCGGSTGANGANLSASLYGSKTTASTLDRIRLTTVNGTDTFDAGSAALLLEG